MDLALFVMFNKSMDFIRRLNRENFYFSSQSFPILWHISSQTVRKTYNVSAQYLKNYAFQAKKKHCDMGCEYHYSSFCL